MILLTKEKTRAILKYNPQKSYVYGLCRNTGEIYYVGIGKGQRVFQHETEAKSTKKINKNTLKLNITRKEASLGGIRYVLFSTHESRDFCLRLERRVVAHYGRVDNKSGVLSNMTDGGDGGVGSATNIVISESTRLKQNIAREKGKENQSKKMIEYWANLPIDERQRLSKHLLEVKNTKKFKDAVGKGMKLVWADPVKKAEILSKRSITMQMKSKSEIEELCKVRSESQKTRWADQDERSQIMAKRKETISAWSDAKIKELSTKLSAASKSRWDDYSPNEKEEAIRKRTQAWQARTPEQKIASQLKRVATNAANKEKKRIAALADEANP